MKITPLKAIRLKCLECSAGSHKEVTLCPITDCELYQFRSGHTARKGMNKGKGKKPAFLKKAAE